MKEISNIFLEGLNRIAKISDYRTKLTNYEKLIPSISQHQKTTSNEKWIQTKDAVISYTNELQKASAKIIPFKADAINSFGTTENNRREFSFFTKILAEKGYNLPIINISDIETSNPKNKIKLSQNFISFAIYLFENWTTSSPTVSVLTLSQALIYTKAFFSFYEGTKTIQVERVPFVIIANDHSPQPVAFSMVAKSLGIPRVYIQHAEVSVYFPPLDFEISILRNQHSLELYQKIAPTTGNIFILPRFETPFAKNAFATTPINPVVVCLYLTENADYSRLNEIINSLRENKAISSIYIKPHPRASHNSIQEIQRLEVNIIDYIWPLEHVALCQNSSIVVELIHRGTRTFQIFGYDDSGWDYYGFVSNNITKEVGIDSLRSQFWSNLRLDKIWIENYSRYDPTVVNEKYDSEPLLCAIRNIARKSIIKKTMPSPSTSTISRLNQKYSFFADEEYCYKFAIYQILLSKRLAHAIIEKMHTNSANINLDQDKLIILIDKFYRHRAPEFTQILKNTLNCNLNSTAAIWLKLKSTEWLYTKLTDLDIKQIINYLEKPASSKFNNQIKTILVKTLVALESYFWLNYIFNKQIISLSSLPTNVLIELSKLPHGTNYLDTQIDQEIISSKITNYDRFKLSILGRKQENASTITHAEVVCQFRDIAPKSILEELENHILSKYKSVEKSMAYMNIQWDKKQRSKFIAFITKKIIEKTPFAFIRLSDGEGYLFQDNAQFFNIEAIENRERHWWGSVIDENLRKKLIKVNREAIEHADVLGIPSIYRIMRDFNPTMTHLTEMGGGITGRGLLEVLRYLPEKPKNTILTEEKGNFALFNDINTIRNLCNVATRVVFVSSVKESTLQLLLQLNNLVTISIPTHHRTQGNTAYCELHDILPKVVDEVIAEMSIKVQAGDLVFISAGVVGKVFIAHAKLIGAISIDLGHTLDLLVHRYINSDLGYKSEINEDFQKNGIFPATEYWACLNKMQLLHFAPYKSSASATKEKEDNTAKLLEEFDNFYRMKNYHSACGLIADKELINITHKQLFQIVISAFYTQHKTQAKNILRHILDAVKKGFFDLAWSVDLISFIRMSDYSYEVKSCYLASLIELSIHTECDSDLSKLSQAKFRFAKFQLDIENYKDINVFDYFSIDSTNTALLKHSASYFPYLQAISQLDLIEDILLKILKLTGLEDIETFQYLASYLPDQLIELCDSNELSKNFYFKLKILPTLSHLSGSSGKFKSLYQNALNFHANSYKNGNKFTRDAILRTLIKANSLSFATELIDEYGFDHKSIVGNVLKGFQYFESDNFAQAQIMFKNALREDPSDSLAANGLRFCLPRTGQSPKAMLEIREEVGYIGSGLTKLEERRAGDAVNAELFSGNLLTGYYHKRKAFQWRHLQSLYKSKVLSYEAMPNLKGTGKSLFLIADEGVGDEVRTAQYYGTLLNHFDHVMATCDPRLFDLLSISFPNIHFKPVKRMRSGVRKVVRGEPARFVTPCIPLSNYLTEDCREHINSSDYITFGQNLFFNQFIGNIAKPEPGPYLRNIDKCSYVTGSTNKIKVGLLWRSAFQTTLRKYMYLDIAELIPLTKMEGVEFWSFQHGITESEIAVCRENGINLIEDIDLFDDFNGLSDYLARMDYIIGVSSLPIELAAALGIKVWMLGFSPENYFLRTAGGKTNIDQLTLNSQIIAPKWIDFSAPRAECIKLVLDQTINLLHHEVMLTQQRNNV